MGSAVNIIQHIPKCSAVEISYTHGDKPRISAARNVFNKDSKNYVYAFSRTSMFRWILQHPGCAAGIPTRVLQTFRRPMYLQQAHTSLKSLTIDVLYVIRKKPLIANRKPHKMITTNLTYLMTTPSWYH